MQEVSESGNTGDINLERSARCPRSSPLRTVARRIGGQAECAAVATPQDGKTQSPRRQASAFIRAVGLGAYSVL